MPDLFSQGYFSKLSRAGYAFLGPSRHSAVKACLWCKKSILGGSACYKNKFYGIDSWRCLQLSVSMQFCDFKCVHCWRDNEFAKEWQGPADDPKVIMNEAVAAQRKLLNGFPGNPKTDAKKWKEAQEPKHVAISLMGEGTLYPKLPELIREIRGRGMTSFLVSNGAHPEILERLADEDALPTQLYLSLTFFDEKSFRKVCGSAEGYEKFLESLGVMDSVRGKARTALRMTFAKGLNLSNAGDYAELIRLSGADYVEAKAWMALGSSRERLGIGAMPSHEEIKEFASELVGECGYTAADEHVPSRVVLLCQDGKALKTRFIKHAEGLE